MSLANVMKLILESGLSSAPTGAGDVNGAKTLGMIQVKVSHPLKLNLDAMLTHSEGCTRNEAYIHYFCHR